MNNTIRIQKEFDNIITSEVFREDGHKIDLPQALLDLGEAVHKDETDESVWNIGEGGVATLSDLVIGSYWALPRWHGGVRSTEYHALCAIGRLFHPGPLAKAPVAGDPEFEVYDCIDRWFQTREYARAAVKREIAELKKAEDKATLKDEHGRPVFQRDWRGEHRKIEYPAGDTYAVCGNIVIIQQTPKTFAVVYGLEVKKDLSVLEALGNFQQYVFHRDITD